MDAKPQFDRVFAALRNVLKKYESRLDVVTDKPENYYLNAGYSEEWKKVIFFGSVSIKKNYVSYYLMPVYMHPELLDGISNELKQRMQGKSCFNFKAEDSVLFKELAVLTEKGFDIFQKENLA